MQHVRRQLKRLVGVAVATRNKLIKQRKRGESLRKWVGRNLDNSRLAAILDLYQVLLGVIVTGMYSLRNWDMWDTSLDSMTTRYIQAFFGTVFLSDYLLRLYAADNRKAHILAPLAIMDFLAILPQFIELLVPDSFSRKHFLWVTGIKTLRPFRCLCCFRLLAFANTARQRETFVLFSAVICIIICFGSTQQAIEACPCMQNATIDPTNCSIWEKDDLDGACTDLPIYNAMYFVVITIATLGYGDIAPRTQMGRLAVIVLIIASSVLLPLQISTLSDVLNRETEYDKAFTERKEKTPHVLICGEVGSGALDFFLRQFLHPNKMNWKDKVVILCPSLPSHNLKRILLNGAYEQRVVYLQGSAMSDADLQRASASTARLCFVLANKLSPDADQSDTASNFITISLRHFNKHVPIFVQVLKSDNIGHLHLSGATNVLCVDQLKMAILAKSCLMPGTAAFLCSVLLPFARPWVSGTRDATWASVFLQGCSHDLYEVAIPAYLDRLVTFTTLAHILFQEHHVREIGSDMTLHVLASTPDVGNLVATLSVSTLHRYRHVLDNFDRIAAAWSLTTFSTKMKTAAKESRDSILMAHQSIRTSASNVLARYSVISMRSQRRSYRSAIIPSCDHDSSLAPPEPSDARRSSIQDANTETGHVNGGSGPLFHASSKSRLSGVETPVTSYSPPLSYVAFISVTIPPNLSDHIVLCGQPNHLRDFIAPLRQLRRRGTIGAPTRDAVPIVIISNRILSKKQYAGIQSFENVYYLRGSPLSLPVLSTARVAHSKRIVILRNCSELGNGENDVDPNDVMDQNMLDTDAITLHRFLTDVCAAQHSDDLPRPTIMIELSRPNSLRFLKDPTLNYHDDDDAMKLLTKQAIARVDDPLDHICNPLYASGKVFVSNALDAVLGTCNKYGSLLELLQLLVLGETSAGAVQGLDQIDVPALQLGRPYGACYEDLLLHQGILCLGIYRARPEADTSYVVVNPSPGLVLDRADKLFVLR
ncbi:hypothetical protein SPRG_19472 [Saprolegnia parasitica CBS 223.65]|uniref:BK channel n=1 Tax=Saprolegnia parasitica (strain CBS 223.65) TaxID=695850 RepID=A0A067CZN8_SAPPC|nr:hypothetical protein SPRG_19472 [Saprolegnia parasitica CBS 223.65]KDO31996.1 hypothetical protein SPRG_19472 [Saprolegnia parasitica CBS 223.65]|eukprot:XP_012197400.1 hypothetical protein SPRG_19472 [Saprolegnia parasitica CBS 223.65]